jgi:capsular exopolysaccharide synthesis family protein
MSRLYEALKEARRNRENGNGQDHLLKALNIDGLDASSASAAPSVPLVSHNGYHSEPPSEPPAALETAATRETEVEERDPVADLATEAEAGLDQKARLLPYAVNPAVVDHYRRLRTKILQQRQSKPFRSLLVTSAAPQEGKTVTVLNLALSFSTIPNFKVVVVDGDLRRGTLGSLLCVSDDHPGLSNLLDGSARLEDVVLKSDRVPMHFVVRGRTQTQVHDLLPSCFSSHFQRLGEIYDLVLIDSPPANILADVQLLAANSDAVLLVARAFVTSRKSLEKAAQELAPFRIIGAVLNAGLTQKAGHYYGYY